MLAFRAKREQVQRFERLLSESQGQNLVWTVLCAEFARQTWWPCQLRVVYPLDGACEEKVDGFVNGKNHDCVYIGRVQYRLLCIKDMSSTSFCTIGRVQYKHLYI